MYKKPVFIVVLVGLLAALAACQQSPPATAVSDAKMNEQHDLEAANLEEAQRLNDESDAGIAEAATAVADAKMNEQHDQETANLEVVRRFYDEYSAGNAEVILEIHPETITMHYAGESEEVPAQILYEDLAALKAANPDIHANIHEMVAAGDLVFTELTWSGTQTGEFFGIPATGNPVVHNGIVVRRLQDGLIVESWEMWDDLTFLNSLGLSPSWDELLANQPVVEPEAAAPPAPLVLPGVYETQLRTNVSLDISAGRYQLALNEDGSYAITWIADPNSDHGGLTGVKGTYSLTGGQITFTDVEGSAACTAEEGVSGTYNWGFFGQSLVLTPASETCQVRAFIFKTNPMNKVVASE
jgi:steroid delta-isomerase-like uncharacterized protein